jgi:NTP pyrophosphatase (non-canonical NTP hydrolase)
MKNQASNQTHKRAFHSGVKAQSGMATALLITIISILVVFVAAGVYAVKNRQIWIAHGITAAMNAVINKSGIPAEEKSQVTEIIYEINENYQAGQLTTAELGLIFESVAKSPALIIGIVAQFEHSYVMPSNLSSSEKLTAHIELNRLARGLSSNTIGWDHVETIIAEISEQGEDGTYHLKDPQEVSDEEIREVLLAVKFAADKAGISQNKVGVDISDEFRKSVEKALGRSLS